MHIWAKNRTNLSLDHFAYMLRKKKHFLNNCICSWQHKFKPLVVFHCEQEFLITSVPQLMLYRSMSVEAQQETPHDFFGSLSLGKFKPTCFLLFDVSALCIWLFSRILYTIILDRIYNFGVITFETETTIFTGFY